MICATFVRGRLNAKRVVERSAIVADACTSPLLLAGPRRDCKRTRMPANNKRSRGQSRRQDREHAGAVDEPVLETNEPETTHVDVLDGNLSSVSDTSASFDVADFGVIHASTTRLCGGLIGRSLRLANSSWPGHSGGSSACAIDGVCLDARWPDERGPAVIVRTIADGSRYGFRPADIFGVLGGARHIKCAVDQKIALSVKLYRTRATLSDSLKPHLFSRVHKMPNTP